MLGKDECKFAIQTVAHGFFTGFNRPVVLGSGMMVAVLLLWIIAFPENSTEILASAKGALLTAFRAWFLYCLAGTLLFAIIFACLPISGRIRLARDAKTKPAFSTSSWLAMMFCGGVGAGIVVYSVAEPISHFTTNPDLIRGNVESGTTAAAISAVKYTFLHWGFGAWACSAILGLALGLFSYGYGLPLTIRTALAPLLGRRLAGTCGNLIDGFAILAIVAGIATTMGYGVKSLSAGITSLGSSTFQPAGTSDLPRLLAALFLCVGIATLTATLGVRNGMRFLANAATSLFFVFLIFFAVSSDPDQLAKTALGALSEYVNQLPAMSLSVFGESQTAIDETLATWQEDWTIFYWSWWLAFAPFVGLFFARISKGRTVREYILGAILAPCGVCFAWFASTGTAALGLELATEGQTLIGRSAHEQLFAVILLLKSGFVGQVLSWGALALICLLASGTFASGILAITTIASGGNDAQQPSKHIVLWSVLVAMVIGALLSASGTASIRDVMVISALPISVLIALAIVSIGYVLAVETRREARNTLVDAHRRASEAVQIIPAQAQERPNV